MKQKMLSSWVYKKSFFSCTRFFFTIFYGTPYYISACICQNLSTPASGYRSRACCCFASLLDIQHIVLVRANAIVDVPFLGYFKKQYTSSE